MSGEYTTTLDDYLAAQKLYLRHRPAARARLRAWMFGLPTLTVVLGILTWLAGRSPDPGNLALAVWLTFCSLMATVAIVILRPFNLKRAFRKSLRSKELDDNTRVRFSFDEESCTSAIVGRSEGRFLWSAIRDFAEDDRIALLFIARKRFLYIPKRALPEDEWQRLREIVQRKVSS